MTTLLLTHPVFVEHDTGLGHPERPDRMRAVDKVLAHELFKDLKREEAPLRDDVEEQIALAHPQSYIDWVKSVRPAAGAEPVRLDPDTVLSPKSWEPALRAVGAGLAAVDRVMDKGAGIANVFSQVRPCGHHAEKERAMGFCIFNNIAIAGLYARKNTAASASPWSTSTCTTATARKNLLVGQEPLFRLHAPDAALPRHRRALRDWCGQRLECATTPRRRRR